MAPKLPSVTGANLVRALKRAGWYEIRQQGSHIMLGHTDNPKLIVVPVHKGHDVKKGLLADILKDVGLSSDDLRRLL